MGYLLGFDAGSSFIKAALLDITTGEVVADSSSPQIEFAIAAPRPGWAEQDPEAWWEHTKRAAALLREKTGARLDEVKAVGISYQMHGLVVVDRSLQPLRPSIIWCDSRAVPVGDKAYAVIGETACRQRMLNSPGNFTASRLAWVKDNEPELFRRIHKAMLPGEYLAMKMTGEVVTTPSGLSEMMLWDFSAERVADVVLEHYAIPREMLPAVAPTFSVQGELTAAAAGELGLKPGTPVSYRAGDQPNNAFSLRVLEPGEAATTAGTSGVVYGVTGERESDPRSRVNVFVHINHAARDPRYGVLMCVNGAGILNRWLKGNLAGGDRGLGYEGMNEAAAGVPPGSGGLVVLPYGNGAERTLENRVLGASIHGLDLVLHTRAHLLRAAQEGIVFALAYGMEIMRGMGVKVETVRAGEANMFLSQLFREIFANASGTVLELYDTDGAQGAARGAGLGAGIYAGPAEAFAGLRRTRTIEPDATLREAYLDAYARWRRILQDRLDKDLEVQNG